MVVSESYINDKGIKRWRYVRTCSCGETVVTTYKPKEDTPCKKCSDKQLGKKMSEGNRKEIHVVYTYFCPTCPSVRAFRVRRKTPYCADCSRKKFARIRTDKESRVKTPSRTFIRICPECEEGNNTIYVASALNAGVKPCRIHKKVPVGTDRKQVSSYKSRKPKANSVSNEAIEKQRELSRKHRAFADGKPKEVVQRRTDEEMMKEFMKNSKPSVMDTVKIIPHYCGFMYIKGDY